MSSKQQDMPTLGEPVAVIGMSCRFSGEASSIEGFWEMLRHGRTGHGPVPSSRYQASAWHHPSHDRKGAVGLPLSSVNCGLQGIMLIFSLFRSTMTVVSLSRRTPRTSMLPFFQSPLKRRPVWIQCNGFYWRWLMKHLKMVTSFLLSPCHTQEHS